jgi:hypothetical protein
MGGIGDLLLSLAGVAVVFAAPLELAFCALVVFWLLVPGTLLVPHAPHVFLVDRLVLYSFAARLLLRRTNGEPRSGAFRLTPVHASIAVLVAVGFADGVLLAPRQDSLASDLHSWMSLLDMLVLFVVAIACVRTIGLRRSVTVIACTVGVAAFVGIGERVLHHGWSHFFFEHLPATYQAPGAAQLTERGSHVRSQGAAQFALEYGWVLAILLPLVVYALTRWSRSGGRARRVALLVPLVVVSAVVLSGSRMPELAAVAVVALLVLGGGGDRRMVLWGVAAVLAAAVVAAVDPSFITAPFSGGASDPASIRLDRLPPLFALVVHRPFTGLGFSGISDVFGGVDDAYALVYATLGVIGLLAWLTVIATALWSTARGLSARRGSEVRALAAACLVGILTIAVAAANYDLVSTAQSTWALVFLAAIGTCAGESVHRLDVGARRWKLRLLMPLTGAALGFVVQWATPVSASETLSVMTVAPWVAAMQGPVTPYEGMELLDTLCPLVTNPETFYPGTKVECLEAPSVFPLDYAGTALVTVRGPTPTAVRQAVKDAFTGASRYMSMAFGVQGTIQSGKPAWATSAPLSGGVAGLVTMFLVPRPRRRNNQRAQVAAHSANGQIHWPDVVTA